MMLNILLISAFFVAASQAAPNGFTINTQLNDEWIIYKTNYGKQYESNSIVELSRRLIWEENLRYIQQHNLEYDLGKHSYYLGLNQFADMTNEEFKAKYFTSKLQLKNSTGSHFFAPETFVNLQQSVDWRTKGYVTPVKNQAQCGSCWSFSTTGSLEGQHFRKTGNLISFSEQQLVDCSGTFGNNGCGGGLMDNAFRYIEQFGIESESVYPYTASDGNCKYDKTKVVGKCTGFIDIPSGDEVALATAVATVGPVSVAIDASHYSFQLYKGGIYNEPQCSSRALDHGVLAVGYGTEGGKNYWIVKNSWGEVWGLSGYIKMSKDSNNQCGIATMASYPLV